MKCSSPEPENEHWIDVFVPEKMEIPPDYYNKEWAKELIEKNQIDEPFNGLHNLGNSCFLNSVIQCLAYTPGLEKFASTLPNVIYENCSGKPCFLHHFAQLCKAMRIMKDPAPHVFFANLNKVSPEMECGSQQDAHEYLFALINKFDDECTMNKGKALPTINTPMHSFFGGTFLETKHCTMCGHTDQTSSKFLDITLPLDDDTIKKCFERNFNKERNIGADYICENCKQTGSCTSKTIFAETPNILVVTMMRFTSTGVKNEKPVDFGLTLDLTDLCVPGVPAYYELFAVINHSGHQINRGHFTCFVKCHGNYWYNADDSKVVKDNFQSVLESRPYVLFYQKKTELLTKPIMVHFGIPTKEKKQMSKSESVPPPQIMTRSTRERKPVTLVQTTLKPVTQQTRNRTETRAKAQTVTISTPSTSSSIRRRTAPTYEEIAEDENEQQMNQPKNPYDGFFSEASDGESDLISEGMMRVEKTIAREDKSLVTIQFVCEKRKK